MDARKKVSDNSGEGKLLNEIETISKALYLDRTRSNRLMSSTASSRSKSVEKSQLPEPKSKLKEYNNKDSMVEKDKKSIWNWKGFKALTHVRDRRFNCYFSLHVHSVEGLPPLFDDLSLVVHWKRRDGELTTRPAMVSQGIAEFEERLVHSCSVYGRSGTNHTAKYEAKHFLLYASIYGNPEVDLGKQRVELTRLLPLTLEELEDEKSSGKWTTSYRLSGKAKGGILNVSFGYEVGNNSTEPSAENALSGLQNFRQNSECRVLRRTESVPARSSSSSHSLEDIKDLHEVLPISRSELSDSITMLYKKLDELKLDAPEEAAKPEVDEIKKQDLHVLSDTVKENDNDECDPADFSTVDKESEFPTYEQENPVAGAYDSKQDLHLLSDTGKENDNGECDPADFSTVDKGSEFPTNKLENPVAGAYDSKKDLHSLSDTGKENENDEYDPAADFSTTDKGSEFPTNKEEYSLADTHDSTGTHEASDALYVASEEETEFLSSMEVAKGDCDSEEADISDKESLMKELESALSSVLSLENEGLDSPEHLSALSNIENHQDMTPNHVLKGKSLNLDDVTANVANEFLDLLGIEHSPFGLSSESDPESPRERLLRQFERETLTGGFSLFGTGEEETVFDTHTESGSWVFPNMEAEATSQKTKASILADMETEALMREYGLDEKAFQNSPPNGFGDPIDMPREVPDQLPSIGQGLGPFVQTKNGEFLRSMNPGLFKNAKNGGSLIMQASRPVVMPAEMGSGVMDILQSLASIGIEKLSMQANKLMPLEDINGNTIQQIAWESTPTLDGPDWDDTLLLQESGSRQGTCNKSRRIKGKKPSNSGYDQLQSNSIGSDRDSEYVSFEDLAPLAIDKIEALAIEGLKIQSGMSDDNVGSANINQQSIGEFSALEGKSVFSSGSIGLEGSGGLQLLDIKNNGDDDVDGLMGLSLTLDEWMKLDAGEIYDNDDDDCISERTCKLLAAHHSKSTDLVRGREKKRFKGRNFGLLGNNFNVALMVQLRDPLRDFEPVGAPMLAVIQVERVFIPPKPRIYSSVSELRDTNEEDDDDDTEHAKNGVKEPIVEEQIPQFKITEVHVAGLKTEPVKNKLWGSTTQQQSGSRWLLANGMGKKKKNSLMKSKANPKSLLPESAAVKASDALWSVSSGSGKQKEMGKKVNSHILNPEVPLRRNEAFRLPQRTGFLGFI